MSFQSYLLDGKKGYILPMINKNKKIKPIILVLTYSQLETGSQEPLCMKLKQMFIAGRMKKLSKKPLLGVLTVGNWGMPRGPTQIFY